MLALSRSRRSQPARGSLRQRETTARRCETEDCRARAARSAALRHQPPAEGLPWMRLKNIVKILRNRDLPRRGDRRQQAQGGHAARGGRHREVQAGEPDHVRLGDQGQAAGRGRV